ncbi:Putative Holin-X, holin superfamily III [Modestobacter sp. DSM 44400]|uniref:phage holin family protein n=1 Tax=Modestobacter sp. DSM 44400 TaxID=1550230 RepID=UPI000899EA90|nr:phage holin family protein [Modestobacter sp. DSM 44400]SDY16587.1 Putative Holin-X, holin superfamily III [Modestobacter sp. DSM 44400]
MAHSVSTHVPGPTGGPAEPSLGTLAKSAMTDVSTLIRSEIELAKAEVGTSVKRGGVSIASFAVAGVMAAFAGIFFFIALAEFLTWLGLARWVAYLIVFAFLLLIAGLAGLVGWRMLKKIEKPERTLETLHDLPDVMRRKAPGQRQHDLPVVRNGQVVRQDPHARLS